MDEKDPDEVIPKCYDSCFCICDYDNNKSNTNLIPGEVKVAYKFQWKFLNATKNHVRYPEITIPNENKVMEAEKVFTQIYNYMNKLCAHYGYLITDQELICIRRRSVSDYGAIDTSGSIPLSVEKGKLNAKLALWYLHHRYVVQDRTQIEMPMTPKKATWSQDVLTLQNKRKALDEEEFELEKDKAHYKRNTGGNKHRKYLRSDSKYGSNDSQVLYSLLP